MKIEKIIRGRGEIRKVEYSDLPEEVMSLLSPECNWIEVGVTPDPSKVRGYRWDGKRKVTGSWSRWDFIPTVVYRVHPDDFDELEKIKRRGKDVEK